MRAWKFALVASVAVLGLAACERPAEEAPKKEWEGPPPGSPVPPKRAPGLWEQRVSLEGVEFVQVSRVCFDEETEAKISWWGQQADLGMCQKNLVTRRTDGSWQFSSVCDMGSGGTTTTSGTASGDFAKAYQVTAETSTVGAATPQMNGMRKMTIQASRMGACPDGMKGGDMQLPGGRTINMLEMMAPPTN